MMGYEKSKILEDKMSKALKEWIDACMNNEPQEKLIKLKRRADRYDLLHRKSLGSKGSYMTKNGY